MISQGPRSADFTGGVVHIGFYGFHYLNTYLHYYLSSYLLTRFVQPDTRCISMKQQERSLFYP